MDINLEPSERLRLAAELIRQSPPGQVNDVIADIQVILDNHPDLAAAASEQLKLYNLEQFTVTTLMGQTDATILSHAAIAYGTDVNNNARYVDPRAKLSYEYDHIAATSLNEDEYLIPEEDEAFRSALEKSLSAYVSNHYPGGTCAVFCSSRPLRKSAPPPATSSAENAEEAAGTESGATDKAEVAAVKEPGATEPAAVEDTAEIVPQEAQEEVAESKDAEEIVTGETEEEHVSTEGKQQEVEANVDANMEATESVPKTGGSEESASKDEEATAESTEEAEKEHEAEAAPAEVAEAIAREEAPVETAQPEETTVQPVEEKETEPAVDNQQTDEPAAPPVFTIQIVANKYNVQNFWTGRWRNEYVVDLQQPQVKGTIKVDVHYFEAGNVQLAAKHNPSFDLPENPTSAASQIITTISKIEAEYQSQLNATYAELGDKAFRSLRRALPITRQKVDWEKIGHWKAARDTRSGQGQE